MHLSWICEDSNTTDPGRVSRCRKYCSWPPALCTKKTCWEKHFLKIPVANPHELGINHLVSVLYIERSIAEERTLSVYQQFLVVVGAVQSGMGTGSEIAEFSWTLNWKFMYKLVGVPLPTPYVYLAKPCLPGCPLCLWTITLNAYAVSYHVSHRKRTVLNVGRCGSHFWFLRPLAYRTLGQLPHPWTSKLYSIPTYQQLFFPYSSFRKVAWGPGLTLTSFSFTFNI